MPDFSDFGDMPMDTSLRFNGAGMFDNGGTLEGVGPYTADDIPSEGDEDNLNNADDK